MKIFFRHMAALGISDAFLDGEPPIEALAAKLINANCVVRLKKGSYNGVEREEIDDILPLGTPLSSSSGGGSLPTALPVTLPTALPGDLPTATPAVEIVPEVPKDVEFGQQVAEPNHVISTESAGTDAKPTEPELPF
jgi:hypothetical protein